MRDFELGKRIVIEGTDGTGKTTAADLVSFQLRQNGIEVIRVDEPDSALDAEGTVLVPAARELRKIIKDGSITRSPHANLAMFTASRFANWHLASQPALERGAYVIQARDFTSSEVFQGYAEGLDIDLIRSTTLDSLGEQYMNPDYKTILDFPDSEEEERLRRIAFRGALEKPDTFESRGDEFQQKLRLGYRAIAAENNFELINAHQTKEALAEYVLNNIMGKFSLNLTFYEWPETTSV